MLARASSTPKHRPFGSGREPNVKRIGLPLTLVSSKTWPPATTLAMQVRIEHVMFFLCRGKREVHAAVRAPVV